MNDEDRLAYAIYSAGIPTLTGFIAGKIIEQGNANTGMAFLLFGFFISIAVSMLYGERTK